MAEKEPRDKKETRGQKAEALFRTPAVRGAGQESDSDEDASISGFAEPKAGDDYTEDATSLTAESSLTSIRTGARRRHRHTRQYAAL
jgi:hypothetical protein